MARKVVGRSAPRLEATTKVTGQAVYAADVQLPGMLFGKVLLSPMPHARILSIDTSRAVALPGVVAVVTGADAPARQYGLNARDRDILAREVVRFVGDRVAAVAAVEEEIAEEALDLLHVEYEERPAILDPRAAMQPNAPLVHGTVGGYPCQSNIYSHDVFSLGDVTTGFAQADYIFEDEYTTPVVHQGYIEPHTVTARVDSAGRVTVWASTQGPFDVRDALADLFGLSLHQVRVIATELGGGFGGKEVIQLEAIAVLMARKTRRPVRLTFSRKEDFLSSAPRPASIIRLKTGVQRDGTLVARQAEVILDTGAHAGAATRVAARLARGPYRIPHFRADAYGVYTHKVPGGPCRAPGGAQVTFAYESQMDRIADELGIDPLALRLKNLLREGDLNPSGGRYPRMGFERTLRAVAEAGNWGRPLGPNQGRGLACGEWFTGVCTSSATVRLIEDGTVQVICGLVDMTGSNTAFAQITAEILTVGLDQVSLVTGDTDSAPYAPETAGSRAVYVTGSAVRLAAEEVRRQVLAHAADQLEARTEDLVLADGRVHVRGTPSRYVTLAEIARSSVTLLGALRAEQTDNRAVVAGGPILGYGTVQAMPAAPTFNAQVAEVEVDPDTGQVTVRRLVTAQDVGYAINPLAVAGQMEGGAVQGLGFALTEEYVFDQGHPLNPSFLDYRLPTAPDVPPIEAVIVEEPSEAGPFGARGVGEPPILCTAPAVANAVAAAVGVRVRSLPITAEKVWRGLSALRRNECD